jgi:predicted DNA-binding transcriptional regulator AlpA
MRTVAPVRGLRVVHSLSSKDFPMTFRNERKPRPKPPAPPGPDALLTPREAAGELRIAVPTLWRGVAQGRLPKPLYPLPRCPRWRRADLHRAAGVVA